MCKIFIFYFMIKKIVVYLLFEMVVIRNRVSSLYIRLTDDTLYVCRSNVQGSTNNQKIIASWTDRYKYPVNVCELTTVTDKGR